MLGRSLLFCLMGDPGSERGARFSLKRWGDWQRGLWPRLSSFTAATVLAGSDRSESKPGLCFRPAAAWFSGFRHFCRGLGAGGGLLAFGEEGRGLCDHMGWEPEGPGVLFLRRSVC